MDIKKYFVRKKQERDRGADVERACLMETGGGLQKMSNLHEKVKEEQECGKNTAATSGHSFKFRFKSETFVVTCDVSKTLQEALSSSKRYKKICSQNKNKEVVLQREKIPKGAVKTDFPCGLIGKDETLDVKFIKLGNRRSEENKSPVRRSLMHSPENFISFNIRTRGDAKIRKLMNNNFLRLKVDYVCVFALKGETLKSALRRDGRFKGVFSKKQCALTEQGTNDKTEISQTVDHLDGKQFEVTVVADQPSSQPSSQELSPQLDTTKNESEESSDNLNSSQNTPGPRQADNPQKPSQNSKQMKPKPNPNKIQVQEIPNTGEILQLLRDQFGKLLKIVKERENLKKPAEVRKFFQEEYDKSAQSFTEVKRVKELMEYSNSVCQIRVGANAQGTGFLLFDKFILTNAHVIKNLLTQSDMLKEVYAVFDYEDLKMGKEIPVKENVVAFHHGEVKTGCHLDFALLELSDTKPPNCPELIHKYAPPPCRGEICIVGHPGGGIKRMDPCFIIPRDQLEMEAKHLAENSNFFQVITKVDSQETWKIYESQISYNSCFFHGSSGSPVFDERCHLIGVHTGGYVYEEGGKTRSVVEYAFPMLPILVQIIKQCRMNGRSDIVEKLSDPVSYKNMSLVFEAANQDMTIPVSSNQVITGS